MAKTTAVTAASSTALAGLEIDEAALALMADDDNHDNFDMRDVALPFFVILQSLSPQIDKQDPAFIKGAEAGMFCNTATDEVFDGEAGVDLVPVKYERRITEWTPRIKGGGLVKDHGTDESVLARCTTADNGKDMTPEGTEVITAGTFYALLVERETGAVLGRVVIGLQSTQFKKAKRWNALITNFQLPSPRGGKFTPKIYGCVYHTTSVPESNDQGRWMGWKFSPALHDDGSRLLTVQLPGGREIYEAAQEFRKLIDAGEVKVAEPSVGGAGGGSGAGVSDEEIPF